MSITINIEDITTLKERTEMLRNNEREWGRVINRPA